MKKSTGILFLVALVLAGMVYVYDRKQPAAKVDPNSEGAHPAFDIRQEDISEITVTRAGVTMVFDLKSDGWHISQPISTTADQAALGDLANTLSIVPEDRTISNVSPSDLNAYGLVNPTLGVEFKLQNGASHKLQIGAKDFSNLEVYSYIDGSKDVALISNVISNAIDKPLEAFRDHSVFAVNPDAIMSFELDNGSGTISAQRDGAVWTFVKPLSTPGSTANIADLFGNLAMAGITGFINDNPNNLSKYGLDKPAIRFRVGLSDGTTRELLIGKKDGNGYDSENTSAGALVRVQEGVRTLLSQGLPELRAKTLFTDQDESVARVEVHNQNGVTACVRDASGALDIEQTSGQKGTPTACPDFMGPLERASSSKIFDRPAPAISAKLEKPAIEVTITDQAGKKTAIQISAASGNVVYGKSSAGPSIYEFDKKAFDDLNYNPASTK